MLHIEKTKLSKISDFKSFSNFIFEIYEKCLLYNKIVFRHLNLNCWILKWYRYISFRYAYNIPYDNIKLIKSNVTNLVL